MMTKYEVKTSASYRRDRKRAKKRGWPLEQLDAVIAMLADDVPLPVSLQDHQLKGEYRKFRECHVDSDWLLVYQKKQYELILMLMYTGTHSDIFDE